MRKIALVLALVLWAGGSSAFAEPIFEDIYYWLPDGSSVRNPAEAPLNAIVKIQETVYSDYDNFKASAIVQNLLHPHDVNGDYTYGLVNGPELPPGACIDLYAYAITNLAYDQAFGGYGAAGTGNGISGFNIVGTPGIPFLTWAPNFANTPWIPSPGFGGQWEWDNPKAPGSLGLLTSQSAGGFLLAVPCGTPHGESDAWVHTWVTLSEGGVTQADVRNGRVSAPIPEPATIGLMLAGLALVARRRR